jgi:hypothetical protein
VDRDGRQLPAETLQPKELIEQEDREMAATDLDGRSVRRPSP